MERVSALEQKNLALETLRKLLTDQIKISERTNLVQAQKFREALEKAMLGYTNKQISTAQMIAHLLELAKWVREAKRHEQQSRAEHLEHETAQRHHPDQVPRKMR